MLVLEARDRPGGRTWTRPFAGSGPMVEIGRLVVRARSTPRCRAELARYGLATRTYDAPSAVRWRTGGELRDGLPVPFGELGELGGRARRHRRRRGGATAPGRSASEARCRAPSTSGELGVPTATREFLSAWWVMIGGTDPERGAVVDALGAIAVARRADRAADRTPPRPGRGLEHARGAHGRQRRACRCATARRCAP